MKNIYYNEINCAFKHNKGKEKICWVITRRCNLKCSHCCTNSTPMNNSQFEKDNSLKLIDNFHQQGIRHVIFSGGEPLLCSFLPDLISKCKTLGIVSSISTNGTLVTEAYIKLLKQRGLNKITLSMDGPESKHDKLRKNEGSFLKTKIASSIIKKFDLYLTINCVIRPELTIEDISQVFISVKQMDIDEITFTFPLLAGRMKSLFDSWSNAWSNQQEWIETIKTLSLLYKIKTTVYKPSCGTIECPSNKTIFGITPENGQVGDCVYLQYTDGNEDSKRLVPNFKS